MKKITTLICLMLANVLWAQPDGIELLDQLIDRMNPQNAKATMKQTILTTSGENRELTYETYSNNQGENSLMKYIEPARVRGNAMLMTGFSDNIWMYNKRTDRIRKLASHAKKQKFEGSDFTYEDMGSGDSWKDDYSPKNLGVEKIDGTECYKLEMTAKSTGQSYSKMLCYVRVADTFPLKIEYFDEQGVHTKTLFLEDIQMIEGIATAMKFTMKNILDQTETMMKYESVTYSIDFPADFFTERNLKNLH